jgi:acyl carrier protein
MTREAILDRLAAIFRDVFDDDGIAVSEATTPQDIEGWDSLGHLNLVVAVEGAFGMKFTMEEVVDMRGVGDMVDMLAQRGADG